MLDWRDYENGIYAFDAGYVRPILAAVHMVVEDDRVAMVDTGSNDALPYALEALNRLSLQPESVDYVILTHIHLDHAGGAASMMRAFPKANLVVHPRGARHMAEPSKLVAGVSGVYGKEYVDRVYGEILPISSERIIEASHLETISLAGRELLFLDTPGHARHHICIVDKRTGGIFSGDMFGLSYRELDVDGRQFIFPTTSPSQFEPEAMHASIDLLLGFKPEAIYLTHYSRIGNIPHLGRELHRHIDKHVEIALREKNSGNGRHDRIKAALTDYLLAEIKLHGCTLPSHQVQQLLATDLELNAQGLGVWLDATASA